MKILLDQIEASLGSRQYFLSLYTTLTIPDIAGALGSENGEASGAKYIAWYEQWARPKLAETVRALLPEEHRRLIGSLENPFTGEACYQFRCSLLHQGITHHPKSSYSRILFVEPGASTNKIHYTTMDDALCIDLDLFCREMIAGARQWLQEADQDANFVKNSKRFINRYATGLAPYIQGVPVIS